MRLRSGTTHEQPPPDRGTQTFPVTVFRTGGKFHRVIVHRSQSSRGRTQKRNKQYGEDQLDGQAKAMAGIIQKALRITCDPKGLLDDLVDQHEVSCRW